MTRKCYYLSINRHFDLYLNTVTNHQPYWGTRTAPVSSFWLRPFCKGCKEVTIDKKITHLKEAGENAEIINKKLIQVDLWGFKELIKIGLYFIYPERYNVCQLKADYSFFRAGTCLPSLTLVSELRRITDLFYVYMMLLNGTRTSMYRLF